MSDTKILGYDGYDILVFQYKKGWRADAYIADTGYAGSPKFRKVHSVRNTVVDMIQDEIDMANCAADKTIQVSNKILHDWLKTGNL